MLTNPTADKNASALRETTIVGTHPQNYLSITICSLRYSQHGPALRSCAPTQLKRIMQADRNRDMLCRPITLVSIVSEMRLVCKILCGFNGSFLFRVDL